MQKTSTQLKSEDRKIQQIVMPRKSTVDFLKQLARAYSYNRLMPEGLGGFVAN